MSTRISGPVALFKRVSNSNSMLFAINDRRRVKGGTVQFEFKGDKQYSKFVRTMRKLVYPLFSSTPFVKLVRFTFGKDSIRHVKASDGSGQVFSRVNLSKKDLKFLSDPKNVARKIREAKAKGIDLNASAASIFFSDVKIARAARLILNTKDKNGVSAFDLLDKSGRGRARKPVSDGRLFSEDVVDFHANTSDHLPPEE
jgi:hypothetical protein